MLIICRPVGMETKMHVANGLNLPQDQPRAVRDLRKSVME